MRQRANWDATSGAFVCTDDGYSCYSMESMAKHDREKHPERQKR